MVFLAACTPKHNNLSVEVFETSANGNQFKKITEFPPATLMMTAAKNPDGTIAVIILNMDSEPRNINLSLGDKSAALQISARAIQTIIISS